MKRGIPFVSSQAAISVLDPAIRGQARLLEHVLVERADEHKYAIPPRFEDLHRPLERLPLERRSQVDPARLVALDPLGRPGFGDRRRRRGLVGRGKLQGDGADGTRVRVLQRPGREVAIAEIRRAKVVHPAQEGTNCAGRRSPAAPPATPCSTGSTGRTAAPAADD